jgi:hypothetical protein
MANAKSIRVLLSAIISAWILCNGSADAATYYVSPQGSDANSCATATSATDQSAAKQTVSAGVACAFAGDTVYLRGGVYSAWDDGIRTRATQVRNGTSWTNAITISGYPGETAILRPGSNNTRAVIGLDADGPNGVSNYIIFQDFTIDAVDLRQTFPWNYSACAQTDNSHHIRFQRIEFKNAIDLVCFGGNGTFIEVLDNKFSYVGTIGQNTGYPVYFSGQDSVFRGNEFFDNGAYALHLYDSGGSGNVSRLQVIGNTFRNNGTSPESPSSCDIAYGYGRDSLIANNVHVGGHCALYVGPNTINLKIYNNTVIGASNEPIQLTPWYDAAQPPIVRNNLFKDNGNGNAPIDYRDPDAAIISDNFSGDPLFVNEAAGDYRLAAGSPAENTGVTLAEVTTDFAGVARPQGSGYDKGAHERVSAPPPPPTNNPPLVGAGVDQTITLPATASLSGTASDDGLPNPPATLTNTWSKVSGPGTVTFGNVNALSTSATFSVAGVYVLRLTASDSALQATDDVTVTVNAAPPPPPSGTTYKWITMPTNSGAATIESTLANWAAQGWFYAGHGHSGNNGTTLTILLQRTQ